MKATTVFVIMLAAGATCAAPVRLDVKTGESLVAVRDKIRAMSAEKKAHGVEIVIADGEYVLLDGMELAAADSGASAVAPVVWRAENSGKARISASPRIPSSSFAKVEDPALLARLPEEARDKVYAADVSAFCPSRVPSMDDAFSGAPRPPAVFMNGSLVPMASYPNGNGWLSFKKRVDRGTPIPGKKERFIGGAFVCEDPRLGRWDFSKGVWLKGYFTHDWYIWSAKVASYGAENGTNAVVRFGDDTPIPYGIMSGTWGPKARRFRAFNLFEELDKPGEWWLDRERKVLYVVPPDGTMSDAVDVRLAFLDKPIVRGKDLSGVHFEGLEFSCNYAQFVEFDDARNVKFVDCRFVGTAGKAIDISGTSNVVSRCEVAQCGSSGISMSGGDRKMLTPCGSVVEGCRIHDFGILQRTYAGGVGIGGCGVVMRGCEIFNAPHAAVLYTGNEHLLESNDVHHVVMETGDAGAFYTGRDWTTQGNVLRYNFIHDIGKGTTERESENAMVSGTNAMGFYFDDCDCGDEAYGNVFLNCPRGILIGGGREHPVRNNVFINCNLGLSIDCRAIRSKSWNTPGGSWHLEGKAQKLDYANGVWAERYPRLANIMNDNPREPLYNPIEGNVFIDCRETINIREVFKLSDNGTAPGLLSRMAAIRDNTVIYTKGEDMVPRKELDPRIAGGFRVLGVCRAKTDKRIPGSSRLHGKGMENDEEKQIR